MCFNICGTSVKYNNYYQVQYRLRNLPVYVEFCAENVPDSKSGALSGPLSLLAYFTYTRERRRVRGGPSFGGAPEFEKPCVPSPGRARQKQAFLGAETLKNPYKNHQMHPSVAPSDARAIAFLR